MQQHEQQYEEQARRILAYLKVHMRYGNGSLPRPFVVEWAGSPSSGKTTNIVESDKFFRRLGFRVFAAQEGAQAIRHIERDTPVYNIRTGLHALTILLDEAHKHTYDLILLDRGIFDPYGWMMYWHDKKLLTPEERELFQQFFLSRWWSHLVDKAFFVICDPQEAMRRELRIAVTQRLGETTNPATVTKLVERYRTAFEQLSPAHPQLELVDTTAMNEQEMVDHFSGRILDAMERRTKP